MIKHHIFNFIEYDQDDIEENSFEYECYSKVLITADFGKLKAGTSYFLEILWKSKKFIFIDENNNEDGQFFKITAEVIDE